MVERNNSPNRNGVFVQPTLTKARAATMVRDQTFDGTVSGNVFASPLFVDGTPGVFVIATENNQISVLDENTGKPVWQRTYGTPAGKTGAGCGNISPLGITGTPVIDQAKRTIYFDAATGTSTTITDHLIHAVSLDDGSERPGWPVSSKTASDGATVKLSGTRIAMAWCANNGGQGSPIITTTDDRGSEAIVWTAGAAGTNKLHAWDAVTGAVVFNGGVDTFAAVRQFTSPIAVKGRIIVAGDNKVYAFRPQ